MRRSIAGWEFTRTHIPTQQTTRAQIVRGGLYTQLSWTERVYTVEQARALVAMWNDAMPETWRYALVIDA